MFEWQHVCHVCSSVGSACQKILGIFPDTCQIVSCCRTYVVLCWMLIRHQDSSIGSQVLNDTGDPVPEADVLASCHLGEGSCCGCICTASSTYPCCILYGCKVVRSNQPQAGRYRSRVLSELHLYIYGVLYMYSCTAGLNTLLSTYVDTEICRSITCSFRHYFCYTW